MTGVILSGGSGHRLRPLTNNVPKTMVRINHKPLLWYHINHLKEQGIDTIWITLHYLPEVVIKYFGDGSKFNIKINYSIEKEPLGTSGALKNPDSNIEAELKKSRFIIVYGDNLTNFNHTSLINFHNHKSSFMTLGTFKNPEPWTGGHIETDDTGKVFRFIEKPLKNQIKSDLSFAGVAVCEPKVLDYIPSGFSDFGRHILPDILNSKRKVYAHYTNSYLQDIGTHQRLKKAKDDLRLGKITFDWKSN